jgi:hypothetical protein
MALNFRFPEETAEKIAERSAQIVRPKEEFSMFVPRNISPSSVSSAAPTAKLE